MDISMVVGIALGGSTLSAGLVHYINARHKPAVSRTDHAPAQAPISASVREEIEETPEWWSKQFHALLEASGAPQRVYTYDETEYDTITEKSYNGRVYLTYSTCPRPVTWFSECMCSSCITMAHMESCAVTKEE